MAQKTPAVHLGIGMNGTWNSLWFLSSTELQANWTSSLLLHYLIGAYFKTKRRLRYNVSVLANQHQVFINAQTLALMKWPRRRRKKLKARRFNQRGARRPVRRLTQRTQRFRRVRRALVKLPFRFTLRRNAKFFLKRQRRWWSAAALSPVKVARPGLRRRRQLGTRRGLQRWFLLQGVKAKRRIRRVRALKLLLKNRKARINNVPVEKVTLRARIQRQARRWRRLRRFWRETKKARRYLRRRGGQGSFATRWVRYACRVRVGRGRRTWFRRLRVQWKLTRTLRRRVARRRVAKKAVTKSTGPLRARAGRRLLAQVVRPLAARRRVLKAAASRRRRYWPTHRRPKAKFKVRTRVTRLHKFKRLRLLPKKRAYFRTRVKPKTQVPTGGKVSGKTLGSGAQAAGRPVRSPKAPGSNTPVSKGVTLNREARPRYNKHKPSRSGRFSYRPKGDLSMRGGFKPQGVRKTYGQGGNKPLYFNKSHPHGNKPYFSKPDFHKPRSEWRPRTQTGGFKHFKPFGGKFKKGGFKPFNKLFSPRWAKKGSPRVKARRLRLLRRVPFKVTSVAVAPVVTPRLWLNAQLQSPFLGYNRTLLNLWRRDWKRVTRLRIFRQRRKKLRRRVRRWRYYRNLIKWLPVLGRLRRRGTPEQRQLRRQLADRAARVVLVKLYPKPRWRRIGIGRGLQLLKARRARRFKKQHQALLPLKTLGLVAVAARKLTRFPTYLTVRRYLARPGWIKFIKHRAMFARWTHKVYCIPTLVLVAVALMRGASHLLVAWLVRLLPVFKQHSPLLNLIKEACKYFLTDGSAQVFRRSLLCQGVRCEVIGKVNGNDRASTFRFQYGAIPTRTLRAGLDMEFGVVGTLYGILGVAVWFFMQPAPRRLAGDPTFGAGGVGQFSLSRHRRNQFVRGPRVDEEAETLEPSEHEELFGLPILGAAATTPQPAPRPQPQAGAKKGAPKAAKAPAKAKAAAKTGAKKVAAQPAQAGAKPVTAKPAKTSPAKAK